MQEENQKRLDTLKKALAIEVQEKGYYLKSAESAANPVVRQLFERLALEEDEHARKFRAIEAELNQGKDWPQTVEVAATGGAHLKAVVAAFNKGATKPVKPARSELDALKDAMGKELQAYDLYKSRAAETSSQSEKKFYTILAGEERVHHLALLDSYEYLTDPAGWYTVKEKWTLEG